MFWFTVNILWREGFSPQTTDRSTEFRQSKTVKRFLLFLFTHCRFSISKQNLNKLLLIWVHQSQNQLVKYFSPSQHPQKKHKKRKIRKTYQHHSFFFQYFCLNRVFVLWAGRWTGRRASSPNPAGTPWLASVVLTTLCPTSCSTSWSAKWWDGGSLPFYMQLLLEPQRCFILLLYMQQCSSEPVNTR